MHVRMRGQDVEIDMRSNMDNVYISKTREIVNSMRKLAAGPAQVRVCGLKCWVLCVGEISACDVALGSVPCPSHRVKTGPALHQLSQRRRHAARDHAQGAVRGARSVCVCRSCG